MLFGDAADSEILAHAGLDRARALVITIPDDVSALTVAVTVRVGVGRRRQLAPGDRAAISVPAEIAKATRLLDGSTEGATA